MWKIEQVYKGCDEDGENDPRAESRGRCDPGGWMFSDSHPFRAEGPNAARSVDVFRECCVNA